MGCSALSLMSRPSHRTTGNYSAADGQPGANYHCKGQGYGTGDSPFFPCSGMSGTPSTPAVISGKSVTRKHMENTLGNFAILKS